MRSITIVVLVVTVFVASSTAPLPPPYSFASPVKILPLGDSITFGCGDSCGLINCRYTWVAPCSKCSGGWRTYLWRTLKNSTLFASAGFRFVGTGRNGPEDIDTHHAGYPGWTIPEIDAIRQKWLPLQPDIILLHLGTNDMGFLVPPHPGVSGEITAKRMTRLLENTFAALPKVHIMLSSIIDSVNVYGGHSHPAYNLLLPGIVDDFTSRGFSISFVDMEKEANLQCKGWVYGDCCQAGVHPTNQGYQKMSTVWFNGLIKVFGNASTTSSGSGDHERATLV